MSGTCEDQKAVMEKEEIFTTSGCDGDKEDIKHADERGINVEQDSSNCSTGNRSCGNEVLPDSNNQINAANEETLCEELSKNLDDNNFDSVIYETNASGVNDEKNEDATTAVFSEENMDIAEGQNSFQIENDKELQISGKDTNNVSKENVETCMVVQEEAQSHNRSSEKKFSSSHLNKEEFQPLKDELTEEVKNTCNDQKPDETEKLDENTPSKASEKSIEIISKEGNCGSSSEAEVQKSQTVAEETPTGDCTGGVTVAKSECITLVADNVLEENCEESDKKHITGSLERVNHVVGKKEDKKEMAHIESIDITEDQNMITADERVPGKVSDMEQGSPGLVDCIKTESGVEISLSEVHMGQVGKVVINEPVEGEPNLFKTNSSGAETTKKYREASSSTEDSDLDSDSDSDFDSDSESSEVIKLDEMDDEDMTSKQSPKKCEEVKTKGELGLQDLPPIEDLHITVAADIRLVLIGEVSSVVGVLVIVQAQPDTPALDHETILFKQDRTPLGQVFETFGPVLSPYYSVRFNSTADITEKEITPGMKIYYAPCMEEWTHFVFLTQLKKERGSDASWENNNEPPAKFLDYSDDEEEKRAKAKNRSKKNVVNGEESIEEGSAKKKQKAYKPKFSCGRQGGQNGYDNAEHTRFHQWPPQGPGPNAPGLDARMGPLPISPQLYTGPRSRPQIYHPQRWQAPRHPPRNPTAWPRPGLEYSGPPPPGVPDSHSPAHQPDDQGSDTKSPVMVDMRFVKNKSGLGSQGHSSQETKSKNSSGPHSSNSSLNHMSQSPNRTDIPTQHSRTLPPHPSGPPPHYHGPQPSYQGDMSYQYCPGPQYRPPPPMGPRPQGPPGPIGPPGPRFSGSVPPPGCGSPGIWQDHPPRQGPGVRPCRGFGGPLPPGPRPPGMHRFPVPQFGGRPNFPPAPEHNWNF